MQVITFKARPRTIIGVLLALVGVAVILLTFVSGHGGKAQQTSADAVSCATEKERSAYLASLGWEFNSSAEKDITIPSSFNQVYENYNALQKENGFDLTPYKGKAATIYTYNITNYKGNEKVIANLIVCDGKLIAADLCDPSAKDGFLTGLTANDTT
ncbi:MAG: DUF4830 domain-containing protein [Eubacterium sp.]|nr:DUF4830 domain-containing protein [Eubacterium sp.]MBR0412455.1 DUF4830 domain-containing protein [Eubacterium sp.]